MDSAGSVIVTGSSGSSGGTYNDYATIKYVPADADYDGLLDSWEVAHFGTTAGQTALDDTDRDSRVELLEMAFASDPFVPDAGATSGVLDENGYLTITLAKQPGVSYLVETGGSPEAAAFSADTTTLILDSDTTLQVRDNFPVSNGGNRFLRVIVTADP